MSSLVGHASQRAPSTNQRRIRAPLFGNGVDDIDRVKIRLDDPATTDPCPPADIGAEDATLEFWMGAVATETTAGAISCGSGWINGSIIIDRDRFNQDREFGISLAGGAVAFDTGRDGPDKHTICGTSNVLDGSWHHIAVQHNGARNFRGAPAGPEWVGLMLRSRLERGTSLSHNSTPCGQVAKLRSTSPFSHPH